MIKKIFFICALFIPMCFAEAAPESYSLSSYSPIIRNNFARAKKNVVRIIVEFVSEKDPLLPSRTMIGSGAIVHPDGIIFTNAHVLWEKGYMLKNITVETWDGTEFFTKDIDIQWVDAKKDMARIKVNTIFSHYAKIDARDFDNIPQDQIVGEEVIAIGAPFGFLSWDIAAGYIVHPARKIPGFFQSLIEVYLHINPGNSGGALFDSEGELIGIPSITITGSGIGFSIPIKHLCDEDKERGFNACAQKMPEKETQAPEHTPLFPSAPSIP